MTLGALAFGTYVGLLFQEGALYSSPTGLTQISLYPAIVFYIQAGLLLHRFKEHIGNQNSLSEHYAMKNKYSSYIQRYGLLILFLLFIVAVILNFFLGLDILFSAAFIISSAYLIETLVLLKDPLSSASVGQKIQAVALLSKDKVKFIQVLASSGKSVAQDDEFGLFLNSINDLMKEIAKSDSALKSISTQDVLVMFEPCGDDILIFILQYRGPALRKLIQQVATNIVDQKISNQEEFTTIVENTLLRTKQDLRVISRVTKDWVIVTNDRSAKYKKSLSKWDLYLQRATELEFSEFTDEWLSNHNPSHILILGGDGSVHSIVNKIVNSGKEIPVGILPAGGGNDISRRWAENHRLQSKDSLNYLNQPLLEAKFSDSTTYIVNTLEWGVGAPTAQLREDNHGRLLSGTSKYFYLVLKAMNKFLPWKADVIIEENMQEYEELSALLVGFGNSSLGGGFFLFPDEFDNKCSSFVMIAKNYSRFHGLKILYKLLKGTHYQESNIEYQEFNNLVLIPRQEEVVMLTIDGELIDKPPVEIFMSNKCIRTFSII